MVEQLGRLRCLVAFLATECMRRRMFPPYGPEPYYQGAERGV